MAMANLITLARFLLLFLLVALAYRAGPEWQLMNAPLLLLIIGLDGLDGYVARKRNETSLFGAIFDIAIDRVVENVLWVVLADLDLVSIWVAIVFITRAAIVDSIRYAGLSDGQTPFGMIRGALARFIVASRFMRAVYGMLKAATFAWIFLFQPVPLLYPAFWQANGPWIVWIAFLLTNASVALCLIRALPVVLEFVAVSGLGQRPSAVGRAG
jgi:CDP-diacylglycerol---glycerol-3-phosphate 3-phosphatidyltransferase